MIVIGVNLHKQAGPMLDETTVATSDDGLLSWADQLADKRLWALEDCRS